MKIKLTSVMVDDQEKAKKFYTGKLGFAPKQDFPVGSARWLTVVSPDEPDGTELALEPIGHDFGRAFQKGLFDNGIPLTAFAVEDVLKEYDRLTALGVAFRSEPSRPEVGPMTAVFDDTCGNYIMIFQT
jgi:catechol 2,3-dioxygenase-like lactoylglutathione lyase family enzyme